MTDPLGPVVITAREIYDQLVRMTTAMTDMTSQIARLSDGHTATDQEVADHETRIRALERGRWPLPAVTALLAVGALVVALIPIIR